MAHPASEASSPAPRNAIRIRHIARGRKRRWHAASVWGGVQRALRAGWSRQRCRGSAPGYFRSRGHDPLPGDGGQDCPAVAVVGTWSRHWPSIPGVVEGLAAGAGRSVAGGPTDQGDQQGGRPAEQQDGAGDEGDVGQPPHKHRAGPGLAGGGGRAANAPSGPAGGPCAASVSISVGARRRSSPRRSPVPAAEAVIRGTWIGLTSSIAGKPWNAYRPRARGNRVQFRQRQRSRRTTARVRAQMKYAGGLKVLRQVGAAGEFLRTRIADRCALRRSARRSARRRARRNGASSQPSACVPAATSSRGGWYWPARPCGRRGAPARR
jgi:hypothetical protein